VAGVVVAREVLDGHEVTGTQLTDRVHGDEAAAFDDRIVVAIGGRPCLAEPAPEVVGRIAVDVHQQMVDETRAVGVRRRGAVPRDRAAAVLVVGVREVEPGDELLGGGHARVGRRLCAGGRGGEKAGREQRSQ